MTVHPFVRYRAWFELALMLLNILFVTQVFRFIENRPTASIVASSAFFILAVTLIHLETRYGRGQGSLAWWNAILFLSLFVIPLIFLRVFFWEKPFDQVGFWGIRGSELHHYSTWAYMVLMVSVVIEGLRDWRQKRR